MIASVKKYQRTEKGKRRRKITDADFKKKNPTYNRDYCKRKRAEAVKEGMCIRCFKEKTEKKKKQCTTCLNKLKEYGKNRQTLTTSSTLPSQ